MEHNKVPGPDGFPAEFYQFFWSVIKDDLMGLFREFHNEGLALFSLNFGVISTPKTPQRDPNTTIPPNMSSEC